MSVVVNNDFSNDTYGIRAERLNAIQGNFSSIQTELDAPANIETWAATCYDDYSTIWSASGVEANESESASLDVDMKEQVLEETYQIARTLAFGLYADQPLLYKDFGFETAFPERRNDKINKVNNILDQHARQVAEGATTLLPASLITRLGNAKDDYVAALQVQDKERTDARHAVSALKKRFESDTKILQALKGWWFFQFGKNDDRIGLIGMVNPDYSGNTGQVPAVPTNLVFNYSSKVLWWDVVPTATSYQLQWFDGTDFIEIYSGSDDHFAYTPADGLNKFKIRSRNNNGYSEFSPVLEQYYFEVLPKAANLQVVQSGTIPTEGELTWDAVPTGFNYKVYQSVDNLGEYAAHWLVIGTVTEPLKSVTLTLGKRNSFKVETNNTYQTSMSDAIFIEV